MINLLVAAAVSLALPAGSPTVNASPASEAVSPDMTNANPAPAMFVVGDGDTTVYVFGTFHALDRQSDWFNHSVRDAFERSDELILETMLPESPQPVPARRIFGAPQVAPSASFLATTKMAINAGKAQGMQVDNGADMVLRHAAEEEGKPVAGLETIESQLAMFTRMSRLAPVAPTPAGAPAPTSGAMIELAKSMADMQSAWKRGDQRVFVKMLGQLNQASPASYKMLFTDRNGRWADWIAARLHTPGTVFVAVGAGHLVGNDSLLVQLAQRGIGSRRVY